MACAIMLVKTLSRSESPFAMVLYMNLILTPLSLIPALFVWRWPSGTALLLVIALGVLAAVAHILLTRSFARADASAVTPFDYARLPFVALIAYLIYGEAPDLWTWVGAGVIAGSAIYIARREAQVAKLRKASLAASESARVRP
jgi:drug/metabolite transporter (DMT)-like permease